MTTLSQQLRIPSAPAFRTGMDRGPVHEGRAQTLDDAIGRAVALLRETQHEDGYWWGELESNPTIEAEYVFLTHILGAADRDRWQKIARHLERLQEDDGGWRLYYGGASDLSTTVECYTALKLAGRDPDSGSMRRARELILSKGGVEKTRMFTKIWLAMLGQWDWHGTPYVAPELILVPKNLPLNVYSFASWARGTVIPMAVILSQRPIFPLPPGCDIDELYVNGRERANYKVPPPMGLGWELLLYAGDRLLHAGDRLLYSRDGAVSKTKRFLRNTFRPGAERVRIKALREIENWIVQRQEADGSWGGIQPPWVYSLIALRQLGRPMDDPVMKKGLAGFEGFAIEDEETWRLQACVSPVWDTCLTLNALLEAGLDGEDPMAVRAAEWLIARQVRTPGDWAEKVPNPEPGGWAFEFCNETYPDTDDAAEIVMAIGRAGGGDWQERDAAVARGMRWLMSMQSKNGGWGSFDKDNTSQIATKLPFFDFGETIDPPSVDVTAHIIEAIGILGWPRDMPAVKNGLNYIWSEQEEDGPWFGRWGVNYIYGTACVLPALKAIGHDMSDRRVKLAADWVESCQNEDGGWGESCASYADPGLRGRAESSPSQTAWALIALMAAGRHDSAAAGMGIDYLVRTQQPDGTWEEPQYTATGFPGYGIGDRRFRSPNGKVKDLLPTELPTGFMIKYHMYRIYWPLSALGRYKKLRPAKN